MNRSGYQLKLSHFLSTGWGPLQYEIWIYFQFFLNPVNKVEPIIKSELLFNDFIHKLRTIKRARRLSDEIVFSCLL